MCGRFTLAADLIELVNWLRDEFDIPIERDYQPRYNIAPTQEVLGIKSDGGVPHLETFRWGLIPSWAKDPKLGNKLINARANTLFEKPSFRAAAKSRRCLILADGFYEWRSTQHGKTPMYVRLRSRKPFGLAGLWESWTSPEDQRLQTCTIVTTDPNALMKPIHHRMPVIVPTHSASLWLDPQLHSPDALQAVLQPYPAEEMEAFEVSWLVNSPANDRPECIQPVMR